MATGDEKRRAELETEVSALRASAHVPYRAILEDMTEMVVRWAPDGTRLFVNDAYCRLFGQRREDIVGTSFWPLVSAEDRVRVAQRIARLSPESPVSTDRHRSIGADGRTVWTEWTDRALFEADGTLIELQSVGRDITERVAAEEKLRHVERADGVARAAASLAHDLANVFQTISIHGELLRARAPNGSFDTLEAAIEDGIAIVRRLQALRYGRPVTRERFDLNGRIAEALGTLQAVVGPDVRLEPRLADRPLPIVGDATQVDQILLNLVRNSSEAMGARGTVVLATEELPRAALGPQHRFAGSDPASCRVLRVSDGGAGVPSDVLGRMFEPRVSTKSDREGLGLATVKAIIDGHAGSIVVETSGSGTTFELAFPAPP